MPGYLRTRKIAKSRSMAFMLLTVLSATVGCAWADTNDALSNGNVASEITDLQSFRTSVSVPSVTLTDHNGRKQTLEALFKDNIVVMDFIFTSCRSICPIMTAVMRRIYTLLGDFMGHSVLLVSISVDPSRDTAEKLAEFSAKTGNHPHWLWLTGAPSDIARVLQAFAINPNGTPETHPPVLFVGHGDLWFKWVGLPNAQSVANAVIQLAKSSSQDDMVKP